ncbi:MAG: AAA family ATPase, partial [Succinatimonas hippei]|nr:AAA family ATPase [Succinatimonas hippei]
MDKLLEPKNKFKITEFLNFISNALYEHFDRQVILLIDEYDVPLAKAQSKGYHAQMVGLYSQFLDILKSSGGIGDIVNKIVMTGCLKVAKNNIFTGANNFTANTVLSIDSNFSSLMGFTADETEKFLDAFDLSKYAGLVKENYDGYHFFDHEIFCAWDVCKFISEAQRLKGEGNSSLIKAENYWIGSENTSTTAIKSYVGFLSENDTQKLQDLSDGKEITITVNDSMNYDSLNEHNVNDMWSLLLHTGYLTAVENPDGNNYKVKIPNLEIKKCFDESIQASFIDAWRNDNHNIEVLNALTKGDAITAQRLIGIRLKTFISLRVYANKSAPENFYEGFMAGMLSSFGDKLGDLKVEDEAGEGYADIKFSYDNELSAMVIEIK